MTVYTLKAKKLAAGTENVSIIDSINNSIIKGHYAEIFKARDSAVVTKMLSISIIDKDTLYIHADTLATGPKEKG